MSIPVFAVVGRPNKGKSSIVATLARDDSVVIEARAGSTWEAREFPMRVDGKTLYTLVDTPGIQRARAVLEWLRAHADDAASRPRVVREFVAAHQTDARFHDECALLQPIVDGAGIIYVVDGSVPFGADYEAEMEILRWTGRPSLAVINPIDNEDYVAEWQAGLGQYFQTVRLFNAQRAEASKQLELLALFGHLDERWRASLDRAVRVLRAEREREHREAATLITEWIAAAVDFQLSQRVPDGLPVKPVEELLFARYQHELQSRERRCRRQIEEVYHYHRLQRNEQDIDLEASELFNVEQWYLWGLDRRALALVAASAGALLGGGAGLVFDGATAGLTGGLGTLLSGAFGAASGGVAALRYADEIAQLKVQGIPSGGKLVSYGPSCNPNFPFVLLGRALLHQQRLCSRTHADRSDLQLDTALLAQVSDTDRRQLARWFSALRQPRGAPAAREALTAWMVARTALG